MYKNETEKSIVVNGVTISDDKRNGRFVVEQPGEWKPEERGFGFAYGFSNYFEYYYLGSDKQQVLMRAIRRALYITGVID